MISRPALFIQVEYNDGTNIDYVYDAAGNRLSKKISLESIAYVSPYGYCGGKTPCYSTIQEAIERANARGVVEVSEGTYNETPILDEAKDVTIQGGWNSTFTSQSGTTILRKAPKAPKGSLTLQELNIMPQ